MASSSKEEDKSELKAKIIEKWEALPSKSKSRVLIGGLLSLLVIAVLISTSGKKEVTVYDEREVTKRESLVLEPEFTEVDMLAKVDSRIAAIRSDQLELKAENEALKAKYNELASREPGTVEIGPEKSPEDDIKNSFPEPPPPIKDSSGLYEERKDPNLAQALLKPGAGNNAGEPRFIGSIMHVEVSTPTVATTKKKNQVYLPPSHMPAVLMTGLKAHTIKGASKDPSQVLLRIQKPAVLPNYVKAQLKGCFVIAEGYGRLDTQRIELRTVSLSCLSNEGKSLIDQEIDGFVVDSDGSVGLAGHVYSHMDKSIGYAFAAGAISGFGEHYALGNSTVQTSGIGTVTTYDPSDSVKNGAAQGIADASEELKDIYLDIVKQAAPVIEVGPTKDVTIVISKGAYLEIKELEL